MQKLVDSDPLLTADAYEGLAEQMGMPADAFVATMEKDNGDVAATDVDSVFGRERLASMVDVPVTLDHGPYYAWEGIVPGNQLEQYRVQKSLKTEPIPVQKNV